MIIYVCVCVYAQPHNSASAVVKIDDNEFPFIDGETSCFRETVSHAQYFSGPETANLCDTLSQRISYTRLISRVLPANCAMIENRK